VRGCVRKHRIRDVVGFDRKADQHMVVKSEELFLQDGGFLGLLLVLRYEKA
jgi:hypothetical protein